MDIYLNNCLVVEPTHLKYLKPPARKYTLPKTSKTNIVPENRALEKEIPVGNHHF